MKRRGKVRGKSKENKLFYQNFGCKESGSLGGRFKLCEGGMQKARVNGFICPRGTDSSGVGENMSEGRCLELK